MGNPTAPLVLALKLSLAEYVAFDCLQHLIPVGFWADVHPGVQGIQKEAIAMGRPLWWARSSVPNSAESSMSLNGPVV